MTGPRNISAKLAWTSLALVGGAALYGCQDREQDRNSSPPTIAGPEAELEAPAATRDARRRQHVRALENVHRLDWNAFVEHHFSDALRQSMDSTRSSELRERLVAGTAGIGSALLEIEGDAFLLKLGGAAGSLDIRFSMEDTAPFGISDIAVGGRLASEVLPEVTRENLATVLDQAAAKGFDGVILVRRDGRTLANRAVGFIDEDRGIAMRQDAVFGIGSQPIDFTIALAHIADGQGLFGLDDKVADYIGEMPPDKRDLTIRHLLEGRSGLPDFLDNSSDWDPDLAWLSRRDLIARAKETPLQFPPGTRQGHSHAAYSLLAAIIEIAAKKPYFDYLKEQILHPAEMGETGMYGSNRNIPLERFAVGAGPKMQGLPNIPPNWGKASWLVIGSGGMYSTLDDLQRFRRFVVESNDLPQSVRDRFSSPSRSSDGSDRGFEHFEMRNSADDVVVVLTNSRANDPIYRAVTYRLGEFMSREVQ